MPVHITGTELFCVRIKTKVQIGYYFFNNYQRQMVLNLKTMIFHIFVKCIRGHITGTGLFCENQNKSRTDIVSGRYRRRNSDLIITIQQYAETVKAVVSFFFDSHLVCLSGLYSLKCLKKRAKVVILK